jgi:hypothetical protein
MEESRKNRLVGSFQSGLSGPVIPWMQGAQLQMVAMLAYAGEHPPYSILAAALIFSRGEALAKPPPFASASDSAPTSFPTRQDFD